MMASIIKFAGEGRYSPLIEFASGSAPEFIQYYGPGPLKLFRKEDIPEVAFLNSVHKFIPDFLCINGRLAVSPEVRSLIELLEPDLHQFFEVMIVRARGSVPVKRLDGSVLQTPYYLCNPGVRLDAVWIERSAVRIIEFENRPSLVFALPGQLAKTTLYKDLTKGHHIWDGENQLGGSRFFSDDLVQAVQERNWKGLRFTHLIEE